MIDRRIIRGQVGDSKRFTAINIKVDPDKLFTDYGIEYIRETAKIMLVKAVCENKQPQDMDEEIKQVLCKTVSDAAYRAAYKELHNALCGEGDSREDFREALMKTVAEVMEGGEEE